jgi:hypothetical protein
MGYNLFMIKETDMTQKPTFTAENVTRIYLGADNACRCGCKGDYQDRGDPLFEKRVKRFAKMWETYQPGDDDLGGFYLNLSYGNDRALTVYFD